MQYFELTCKAYLKSDLLFDQGFEKMSKFINFAIMRGEKKALHEKIGFKHLETPKGNTGHSQACEIWMLKNL